MNKINFDKTVENEIVKFYQDGESIDKIAKKIGVSVSPIKRVLKENEVKMRTTEETSRKYYHNMNYFEILNSEEKWYWLGFIYADGYIIDLPEHYGYGMGIALSSKDKTHLEKFRLSLRSNNPILTYKNVCPFTGKQVEYVRIILKGKKIKDDLKKQGISKNKTYNIKFPDFIPKNELKHFIRGYFDGDGGLHIDKKGYLRVYLTGNSDFLNEMFETLNYSIRTIQRKSVVDWQFRFQKEMKEFLNYMYRDSNIYLDRKYELYDKISETTIQPSLIG